MVPKEEILAAVWPDRVVEEANLTQNISVIRKTLGVAAGEPGHIETFPGRGYRLEGPVYSAGMRQTAPNPPLRTGRPAFSRFWGIAAAAVALLALAVPARVDDRPRPAQPPPSVGGLIPVTRMPGKEFQPAISPDGRSLAFLWARSGDASPRLWIRNLETGEQHEISSTPGHHSSPCWSPDSKQVAYLRIGPRSTEVLLIRLSDNV